jgi:hypothetical protein
LGNVDVGRVGKQARFGDSKFYFLVLAIHTNTSCRSFVKRKQTSPTTKRTRLQLLSTPINHLSMEPQMPQTQTEAEERLLQPLAYLAHALTRATLPLPTKAKPTHPATTSPAFLHPCHPTPTPQTSHPIVKPRHSHPRPATHSHLPAS